MEFLGHYLVTDLMDRYEFGKTKVYGMIADLKIQTVKNGKKSYVTDEALDILDKYVAKLNGEGAIAAEAYKQEVLGAAEETAIAPMPSGIPEDASGIPLGQALSAALVMLANAPPAPEAPSDALAPQKALSEAVREGYVLTSAQVRQITGIKTWSGGSRFGFIFESAGKEGRQLTWRVKRAS